MLLITHISIGFISLAASLFTYAKINTVKEKRYLLKLALLTITNLGTLLTGIVLVIQGGSMIRVCAVGLPLILFNSYCLYLMYDEKKIRLEL